MNKNIKKVIAIVMAVGTISAVGPINSTVNLLTTKAYASSSDNSDDELSSLKLETSSDSSITLYSDDDYKSDNKVSSSSVSKNDDYYAKTSSSTVHVSISGVNSKYVRVFKSSSDDISSSAKGKKASSDISLSSGKNTIVVRIYDEEPDDNIKYDDDSDKLSEYTIHVKCTGNDSSDSNDDNNDDIYLKSLSINGESVSLSNSQTTYTYNVASNVDSVPIKAKPDDSDYTVEIDGHDVDDSDNYKKDVDLNKGENDFKVKVTDSDDNERDYTLKITRADSAAAASTSATTTATSTQNTAATVTAASTTAKIGWVQINGGWQYNDSLGTPLKGQWFYDRNYGKWYYLGADGMMAHDTYIGQWRVGSDGAWIS